jgi:hypothetical protein
VSSNRRPLQTTPPSAKIQDACAQIVSFPDTRCHSRTFDRFQAETGVQERSRIGVVQMERLLNLL